MLASKIGRVAETCVDFVPAWSSPKRPQSLKPLCPKVGTQESKVCVLFFVFLPVLGLSRQQGDPQVPSCGGGLEPISAKLGGPLGPTSAKPRVPLCSPSAKLGGPLGPTSAKLEGPLRRTNANFWGLFGRYMPGRVFFSAPQVLSWAFLGGPKVPIFGVVWNQYVPS